MIKSFDDSADPEPPLILAGNPNDWRFPARELEQRTGMRGISARWIMPDGKTEKDYGTALRRTGIDTPEAQALAREELQKLMALNPELRSLNIDPEKTSAPYHILMGTASGLNKDDIQHFINEYTEFQEYAIDPETGEEYPITMNSPEKAILEKAIGASIKWTISEQTMKKIQAFASQKTGVDFDGYDAV